MGYFITTDIRNVIHFLSLLIINVFVIAFNLGDMCISLTIVSIYKLSIPSNTIEQLYIIILF